MIHRLKILPIHFFNVQNGLKKFEVRKNDRKFELYDEVILQEWSKEDGYTGNQIAFEINYILPDFEALKNGYVIFSVPNEVRLAYNHNLRYHQKNLEEEVV